MNDGNSAEISDVSYGRMAMPERSLFGLQQKPRRGFCFFGLLAGWEILGGMGWSGFLGGGVEVMTIARKKDSH